jgi:hypothetical protein
LLFALVMLYGVELPRPRDPLAKKDTDTSSGAGMGSVVTRVRTAGVPDNVDPWWRAQGSSREPCPGRYEGIAQCLPEEAAVAARNLPCLREVG